MSDIPALIKYAGNLLIGLGALLLMMSLGQFYTAPIGLAVLIFCGTLIMLISFVGLRLMKRWSLYIFSGLMIISLACYLISFLKAHGAASNSWAMSCIIPLIYYSAAIPYWQEFD